LNSFILASDEHMCVESPKHELRCPLVKEGATTCVLSNNKWFWAYKKSVVTHVLMRGHLTTSFGDWVQWQLFYKTSLVTHLLMRGHLSYSFGDTRQCCLCVDVVKCIVAKTWRKVSPLYWRG